MKINDYIYLATKNVLSERKRYMRYIALLSISIIILIFSLTFKESINDYVEKNIKNNIFYRTIYVGNPNFKRDEGLIKKVEEISHIEKIIKQENFSTYVNANIEDIQQNEGSIKLIGCNENISPSIIKGRYITDEDKNVCIIPKEFYIGDINDKYNETDIIDGEKLIGKKITVSYSMYEYKELGPVIIQTYTDDFYVVGIYDNNINMGYPNECYVSFNDVENINKIILTGANIGNGDILVIADNWNNVDGIISELEKQGFSTQLYSVPNYILIDIINIIGITMFTLMLILSISTMIINSIKTSKDREKIYGLLKTVGYSKKNILIINFIENIIIGLISFIIGVIISLIIIYIINNLLYNFNFEIRHINLKIKVLTYLMSIFISIFIPNFASMVSNIIIVKKSIIQNKEGD
ncbi:MAG: FtsX-like permease family protein [Clostridia bacterium]|nr:FtsX-like permease family protein [Clostridia bacterium]